MLVVNGLAECGELVGGENTTPVACEPCWRLDVTVLRTSYNTSIASLYSVNSIKCLYDFDFRATVLYQCSICSECFIVLISVYNLVLVIRVHWIRCLVQYRIRPLWIYFFLGCLYHEFLLT